MTYVVTESCIKCKYTDCVDVCPVDAIFAEEDVPMGQRARAQEPATPESHKETCE